MKLTAVCVISAIALIGVASLTVVPVIANHPVLVEGNCPLPTSRTNVPPGTCGDYDGDGLIGTAEDADGDRVFGTITAALGAASGGANQNGEISIVTSGIFAEVITITAANGNVTIEAAPGVDANIDAVLAGDAGSTARQGATGVTVNAPADRFVTIRNVRIRNWANGIVVSGSSRVAIEDCRIENNVDFGIAVTDNARVTIDSSQVRATGFRVGGTGDFPRINAPAPGIGISFSGDSSGAISFTTVVGNFAAGLLNGSSHKGAVCVLHDTFFDNNPNLVNVNASRRCE